MIHLNVIPYILCNGCKLSLIISFNSFNRSPIIVLCVTPYDLCSSVILILSISPNDTAKNTNQRTVCDKLFTKWRAASVVFGIGEKILCSIT